ncbi:alpha/beta hydrolase [Rheinheimera muenzenbergensis]|uniref:Alpha/beta hydrolase n=1 Tax=Rheinheimera muenzenbergensis TaxID=1193628 RepID=A0ABU8C379_9GAMM
MRMLFTLTGYVLAGYCLLCLLLYLLQRQFPLFPVKWLLKDTYNSVAYAPGINSPTLILLAEQDEIIGRTHSEALYRAFAPGVATLKSYSGSHNTNLPASQLAAWLAAATL